MSALDEDIKTLIEDLEENPDPWFNHPQGWLLRPSYKRALQKRGNDGKRSSWIGFSVKELVTGSQYKRRWFVLDEVNRALKYYKEEHSTEQNGWIDLAKVTVVNYSTVADAPPYSIDLVTQDTLYTLVGSSQLDILRWAFVIRNLVRDLNVDSYNASSSALTLLPEDSEALLGDSDIPENSGAVSLSTRNKTTRNADSDWLRFDYIVRNPGPLYLNIMGTVDYDAKGEVTSYWLLVSGFASGPNGEQSELKASGLVRPKDYIVGVNGTDISDMDFQSAMKTLRNATLPKTMHFLRDLRAKRSSIFVEGCATVFYDSMTKRRKRYYEMHSNYFDFRKPSPGGGAVRTRDSYFLIDQVSQLRPIIDKSAPDDQRYKLQLNCLPGSILNFVGMDDQPVGSTLVTMIELCFPSRDVADEIIRFLSTAELRKDPLLSSLLTDIPVAEWETVASAEDEEEDNSKRCFGLKSFITGTFSLRSFTLRDGFIEWAKLPTGNNGTQPQVRNALLEKPKKMFIANEDRCGLRGVTAFVDSLEPNSQFKYQLSLIGQEQTITIGMPDELTLMHWLDAIRELVEASPESQREDWDVPDTVGDLDRALVRSEAGVELLGDEDYNDDDELTNEPAASNPGPSSSRRASLTKTLSAMLVGGAAEDASDADEFSKDLYSGFLYYRHNVKSAWKKKYSRYFCVVRKLTLFYYKSEVEAGMKSAHQGKIDLRSALEVREAQDRTLPENFFEIVTPSRTFTLGAQNESQFSDWLEVLGDILESRMTLNISSGKGGKAPLDVVSNERTTPMARRASMFDFVSSKSKKSLSSTEIEEMKQSIIFQGGLGIRSRNNITKAIAWKDRYFIIANGSFQCYDNAESVFSVDNCEISLTLDDIQFIESTQETGNCQPGCAFDVHTYVGNEPDIKLFTFLAQSPMSCIRWMEQLCSSTQRFTLVKRESGGYESGSKLSEEEKKDELRKRVGLGFVKGFTAASSSFVNDSPEPLDNHDPEIQSTLDNTPQQRRKSSILDIRYQQSLHNQLSPQPSTAVELSSTNEVAEAAQEAADPVLDEPVTAILTEPTTPLGVLQSPLVAAARASTAGRGKGRGVDFRRSSLTPQKTDTSPGPIAIDVDIQGKGPLPVAPSRAAPSRPPPRPTEEMITAIAAATAATAPVEQVSENSDELDLENRMEVEETSAGDEVTSSGTTRADNGGCGEYLAARFEPARRSSSSSSGRAGSTPLFAGRGRGRGRS